MPPPRKADQERDSPRSEPQCTQCGSHDADVISLFGTQAMTLQYRCRVCGTLFEAIKYEAPPDLGDEVTT
jgi:uncharacterized Zn finger protein